MGDPQGELLVQHHMHFNERLLSNVIDHHVVETDDPLIVLDGDAEDATDVLLLRTVADNERNVLEGVGEPGNGDGCAENEAFNITK